MRILGVVVVAAALALTSSVSLRPVAAEDHASTRAAPTGSGSTVQEYPAATTPGEQNSCKLTGEAPYVVSISAEQLEQMKREAAAAGFVSLNTRGYNYPSPDDPPDRFVPTANHPSPQSK